MEKREAQPVAGKSWGPVGKSGPVKSAGGAGSAAERVQASRGIRRRAVRPPVRVQVSRSSRYVQRPATEAPRVERGCLWSRSVPSLVTILSRRLRSARRGLFYRPIFDPKLCEERNFRRSPDAAFCRRSENLAQSGLVEPTDAPLPGKTDGSWRARGTPTANCDPAYLADRDAPRDGAECPVVPNTPIRPRVRDRTRRTRRRDARNNWAHSPLG